MIKNFFIKYKTYIISCLIALGVGLLSAFLTRGNMNLSAIKQPFLSPPAFLFPLVWTALYILMGISAARIFGKKASFPEEVRNSLSTYASSLIVNFAWSIIFFNFGAFFLAFIWIILLEFLIIKTINEYKKIDKTAAFLQIPYAVWVAFAGYLTISIAILNR
ncbi:MAG: tryptophan-rich sensory protein [Ruminococcaceae bacterium]|nr:tryptophan-rich sensory protein [Oscillospiraceae bacterium]